jgi:mannose-6-phosphate isomerase-like protein (cupin superfamily)
VKGSFDMHPEDKIITLNEGEFLIVPGGVKHKPVAAEEVEVMLFEPASTLNTGNVENDLTKKELQHI